MALADLALTEALEKLRSGEINSAELTQAYLDRIELIDPKIDAYLTVTAEKALAQAKQADERRSKGNPESAPLLGLPLPIKHIICTEAVKPTDPAHTLERSVPPSTRPPP